ncbi:hypothetical protein PIIN_08807 [Serendipita indica DSM 11827]|uniref:Sm domain-containing protein n=1 Tax=Serendipita indica (strain DSM 11827) TaxID=1109443 RepID=G4TU45_SERID|nr:hypothetical protein PIIN_08807 [Serendipita indica DSM 11827]
MHRSYYNRFPVRRRDHASKDTERPKKFLPPMYDYLDKPVFVQLKNNGGSFSGTLTGFDVFQNLVLANSTDESHHKLGAKVPMGEIASMLILSPYGEHVR